MTDTNPACAIMTADCPPENDCRLAIDGCGIEQTEGNQPNLSRYLYRCTRCGKRWTVDWPQVQPVYDREGNVAELAAPLVAVL